MLTFLTKEKTKQSFEDRLAKKAPGTRKQYNIVFRNFAKFCDEHYGRTMDGANFVLGHKIIFAIIPLILSIGIIPLLPFSDSVMDAELSYGVDTINLIMKDGVIYKNILKNN